MINPQTLPYGGMSSAMGMPPEGGQAFIPMPEAAGMTAGATGGGVSPPELNLFAIMEILQEIIVKLAQLESRIYSGEGDAAGTQKASISPSSPSFPSSSSLLQHEENSSSSSQKPHIRQNLPAENQQKGSAADVPQDMKTKAQEMGEAEKTVVSAGEEEFLTALPSFVSQEFKEDFLKNPAEAAVNLLADLYHGRPEAVEEEGSPLKSTMDTLRGISRQTRKDRLLEKYQDAREMIQEIEKLFKNVPEIEKRPDAYELAYNLVKAQLTRKDGKRSTADSSKLNLKDEGKAEKTREKEKAFVEGKKGAVTQREGAELTPAQKEICRNLDISEKTFVKYLKK